jgi:hypothetical protein
MNRKRVVLVALALAIAGWCISFVLFAQQRVLVGRLKEYTSSGDVPVDATKEPSGLAVFEASRQKVNETVKRVCAIRQVNSELGTLKILTEAGATVFAEGRDRPIVLVRISFSETNSDQASNIVRELWQTLLEDGRWAESLISDGLLIVHGTRTLMDESDTGMMSIEARGESPRILIVEMVPYSRQRESN